MDIYICTYINTYIHIHISKSVYTSSSTDKHGIERDMGTGLQRNLQICRSLSSGALRRWGWDIKRTHGRMRSFGRRTMQPHARHRNPYIKIKYEICPGPSSLIIQTRPSSMGNVRRRANHMTTGGVVGGAELQGGSTGWWMIQYSQSVSQLEG